MEQWKNVKNVKLLLGNLPGKLMGKEILDLNVSMSLTVLVKNRLLTKSGYSPHPYQLVFGRNIKLTNLTAETKITELNIEDIENKITEETLTAMRKAWEIQI